MTPVQTRLRELLEHAANGSKRHRLHRLGRRDLPGFELLRPSITASRAARHGRIGDQDAVIACGRSIPWSAEPAAGDRDWPELLGVARRGLDRGVVGRRGALGWGFCSLNATIDFDAEPGSWAVR
jgi:hypothetical protein